MSHQDRVQRKTGPAPVFHPMRTWRAFCFCRKGGYEYRYDERAPKHVKCPNCDKPMLTEQVKA
jgi:hypothetical protein